MSLEIWAFLFMATAIGLVAAGVWGLRASFRPVSLYQGRHRGPRRASYLEEWLLHRAIASDHRKRAEFAAALGAFAADRALREFPELADAADDPAEFDVPAQVKGAYAHLRTEELDSTAERFWRLVDRGIRPPSAWGTPSTVDEWDPLPDGIDGYAIAGRTR